jgi:hypothetical protein
VIGGTSRLMIGVTLFVAAMAGVMLGLRSLGSPE